MLKCGQKDNKNYTFGISKTAAIQQDKNKYNEDYRNGKKLCNSCNEEVDSNAKICQLCGSSF